MVDFLDAMIDGWVNQIVMVIGQMPWLGPLLALIAGRARRVHALLPVEHTVDRWLHQRTRRKNNEARLSLFTHLRWWNRLHLRGARAHCNLRRPSPGNRLSDLAHHPGPAHVSDGPAIWDVINITRKPMCPEKQPAWVRRALFSPASSPGFLPALAQRRSSLPFSPSSPEMDGFSGASCSCSATPPGTAYSVLIAGHLRRFRAAPQRQRPLRAIFVLERKNPRRPHFCRWHLYVLACSVKQNACAADDVSARRRLFILRLSY